MLKLNQSILLLLQWIKGSGNTSILYIKLDYQGGCLYAPVRPFVCLQDYAKTATSLPFTCEEHSSRLSESDAIANRITIFP